ncbi:unnamed protein product, partial [Polarella glacialis]
IDDAFKPKVGGNPGEFEAWIDIGRPIDTVVHRVEYLIKNDWLELSTQGLLIEGIFANLEAHIYSYLKLHIKITRQGLVAPEIHVLPLRGSVFQHWSHVFINVIFAMVLMVQFGVMVQQINTENNRGLLKLHLRDVWTWLDIGLVLGGIILIVWFGVVYFEQESFKSNVVLLGDLPIYDVLTAREERFVQATLMNRAFQGQVTKLMDHLIFVIDRTVWLRSLTAWYVVMLTFRFFRGYAGQPRTAVLLQAMMYMAPLFLHYLVVWVVVFCNFALMGYILFGEQLYGWHTAALSITSLLKVLLGESEYKDLSSVSQISAFLWWWSFFIVMTLLLARVLTAAVLRRFLEVRAALGEPGIGMPQQIANLLKNLWHIRSYEGAIKSTPEEELLDMLAADLDPAHVKQLMQMMQDRRLTTREDLSKAQNDKIVDVEFLVSRGLEPQSAERLLERCQEWAKDISMTSSATHRLMMLVARQMAYVKTEADRIQRKVRGRVDRAAQAHDRVAVKHAKSVALGKRIRRAQTLPPGWTPHRDESGRRYLRHEESGLTSWTLPRHLI